MPKTINAAEQMWITKAQFNALDMTTVEEGTVIHIVDDRIEKGDLSDSLQQTIDGAIQKTDDLTNTHNHDASTIKPTQNYTVSAGVSELHWPLFNFARANRLALMDPRCIKIEVSDDAGTTWVDYSGITDSNKVDFVTKLGGANLYLGTAAGYNANSMLRVTFDNFAISTAAERYCQWSTTAIWASTSGTTGIMCKCEASTIGAKDTFTTVFENVKLLGWSGINEINHKYIVYGGSSSQTTQTAKMRFTFSIDTIGSSTPTQRAVVSSIFAYGKTMWSGPNNLCRQDRLYEVYNDKSAIFPANVYVGPRSTNNRLTRMSEVLPVIATNVISPDGLPTDKNAIYYKADSWTINSPAIGSGTFTTQYIEVRISGYSYIGGSNILPLVVQRCVAANAGLGHSYELTRRILNSTEKWSSWSAIYAATPSANSPHVAGYIAGNMQAFKVAYSGATVTDSPTEIVSSAAMIDYVRDNSGTGGVVFKTTINAATWVATSGQSKYYIQIPSEQHNLGLEFTVDTFEISTDNSLKHVEVNYTISNTGALQVYSNENTDVRLILRKT